MLKEFSIEDIKRENTLLESFMFQELKDKKTIFRFRSKPITIQIENDTFEFAEISSKSCEDNFWMIYGVVLMKNNEVLFLDHVIEFSNYIVNGNCIAFCGRETLYLLDLNTQSFKRTYTR